MVEQAGTPIEWNQT
jgi:hypothetical protein